MPTIDTAVFAAELDRFEGAQEVLTGAIDAYLDAEVPALANARDAAAMALAFAVLRAANQARRKRLTACNPIHRRDVAPTDQGACHA